MQPVVDAVLTWLRANSIAAYHGTRLTESETESIRANGLIPLRAENRKVRLARALSSHPRWTEVRLQLESAIQAHGQGNAAGHRQGQVHFTLSRASLTTSFNHYLSHGAEFDQHVASKVLGQDGIDLLALDGLPTVIKVAVPGQAALDGAHPHLGVDDMIHRGEMPNLVSQFLESWAYKIARPLHQSRTQNEDCGIQFKSTVPAAWIELIENVPVV